jgi:hypothetical protein
LKNMTINLKYGFVRKFRILCQLVVSLNQADLMRYLFILFFFFFPEVMRFIYRRIIRLDPRVDPN